MSSHQWHLDVLFLFVFMCADVMDVLEYVEIVTRSSASSEGASYDLLCFTERVAERLKPLVHLCPSPIMSHVRFGRHQRGEASDASDGICDFALPE